MSLQLTQEQSTKQSKDESPAEGSAPETAAAEPSTIPDQDEPEQTTEG